MCDIHFEQDRTAMEFMSYLGSFKVWSLSKVVSLLQKVQNQCQLLDFKLQKDITFKTQLYDIHLGQKSKQTY